MAVARDAPGAKLLRLLRELPDGVTADVRLIRSAWTTVRFAGGRIHQPHAERSASVSFRVAEEGRLGTATTSDLSPDGLAEVVRSARSLARAAPRERKFPGFPEPRGTIAPVRFSPRTAGLGPEEATRLAARAIQAAVDEAPGARVAGAVNVGMTRRRVFNSSGLDRTSTTSGAQASVLVERPEGDPAPSGWSEGAHWDALRLRPEQLGREAAERAARAPPAAVAPGTYRVVLRGPAVALALAYLATLGFGAQSEVEGTSFLKRSRGRAVAPTNVTLVDDARSPESIPQAIDDEGLATRRTPLLSKGRVGPAVADLVSAGRLGVQPTGHALPPEAPWGDLGAVPAHLLLAADSASEEELIRETRNGLLVTRFHYVRIVDLGRGVLTGMTRDGTYRIARGELAGPVRNLRFTESLRTLLGGIEGIGRERRTYADERCASAQTVPALAARSFRFTSATLF